MISLQGLTTSLELKTHRSRLTTRDTAILKAVRDATSYIIDNLDGIKQYGDVDSNWDGRIYIVDWSGYFSTGYTELIYNFLVTEGVTVTIIDTERSLAFNQFYSSQYGEFTLFDHQYKCLGDILTHNLGGISYVRGLINAATNSGKSLILAALTLNYHGYTLILIHNRLVFKQLVQLFKELGVVVGEVRHDKIQFGKVTIAMEKTFLARYKSVELFHEYCQQVGLLIVDEVHRAGADDYDKLLSYIPCFNRIGFSGTSLEGTQKQQHRIIAHFGSVITHITNNQMIEKGVSSDVVVEIHNVPYGKYADMDSYKLVTTSMYSNRTRLAVITQCLKTYSRGILIVCDKVEHAEILAYWLRHDSFNVEVIEGKLNEASRLQHLSDFESGKIDALITTSVLKEGVNIKGIRTLVMAMAGKSPITVKQFVGRGLRAKLSDNTLTVVDFLDQVKNFREQSLARVAIYEGEGFKIEYR